jgi:hypothetical protein
MTVELGAMLVCSGFLLAVLWMDLIFDVQVRAARGGDIPEQVLASIAGYYHRATTTSRPMSRLIAVVMVILLAALVVRGIRGHDPGWLLGLSAVLVGAPILLAAVRTVPNAVRLGHRRDDLAGQARLAQSIYRDHVLCLAGVAAFVALWLSRVW